MADYKHAFTINEDKGCVASYMWCKWPSNIDPEAIWVLAGVRNEAPWQTAEVLLPPKVSQFCEDYIMLSLRARYGNERGPFVVTATMRLTPEMLYAVWLDPESRKKMKQAKLPF